MNIIGGGDNLQTNTEYSLSITTGRGRALATVPEGAWQVFIDTPDELLNRDNSFILELNTVGKTIEIQYVVDGEVKLSRTCKVIR